jgi:hypothetical protein
MRHTQRQLALIDLIRQPPHRLIIKIHNPARIGQRGLNLGFGARVTRSEEGSADTGFIFNLGYQF